MRLFIFFFIRIFLDKLSFILDELQVVIRKTTRGFIFPRCAWKYNTHLEVGWV